MSTARQALAGALPLLLCACGGVDQLGDGGPCGQWYFHLQRTESCSNTGPSEHLSVAHVSPAAADEQTVRLEFGNQEWVVDVAPSGVFTAIEREGGTTTTITGRFSGDDFEGELVFDVFRDSCRNAYSISGQKLLDYPSEVAP